MKGVNVSELQGAALDWAVAKSENIPTAIDASGLDGPGIVCGFKARTDHTNYEFTDWRSFMPSVRWDQGGPIIEREKLKLRAEERIDLTRWVAATAYSQWAAAGPTPLVAAMRCYVASKMGDEIEVPDELH